MQNTYLLQVTPEELEWFRVQTDFMVAYDEFIYNNRIECSFRGNSPPGREISLENFDLSLLMTSLNPPIEGRFTPEEMLLSCALAYGKHEIDTKQNLSFNSPDDVACIAMDLESLSPTILQSHFDENIETFLAIESPTLRTAEDIKRYQTALFDWVVDFYQSARAGGYAVFLRWN